MRSALVAAIQELANQDIEDLSVSELADSIAQESQASDLLAADRARRLARFDKLKGFELFGSVDTTSWLRDRTRMSGGAAHEQVQVARELQELPLLGEALSGGQIGFEQAAVIARAADQVGEKDAPHMAALSLQAAQEMDAGQLRHFADEARAKLNARAFLDDANHAYAKRRVAIGQVRSGMCLLEGTLTLECAAYLRTALGGLLGPRSTGDDRTPG